MHAVRYCQDAECPSHGQALVDGICPAVRPLACAFCGADDALYAWYPQHERQTINPRMEGETLRYDYTGCTRSADDAGEDDSFYCSSCDTTTESLEDLLGLPAPDHVVRARLAAAAIEWLTDDRDPSTRDLLTLEGLRASSLVDTVEEARAIVRRVISGYGTLADVRAFLAGHDIPEDWEGVEVPGDNRPLVVVTPTGRYRCTNGIWERVDA